MTPAEQERAKHIDAPEARHRCVLLDVGRIRCLDCQQTLLIPELPAQPVSAGATSSTSSNHPLPLRHPEACRIHVGQRKGSCGGCRADALVEAAYTAAEAIPEQADSEERYR